MSKKTKNVIKINATEYNIKKVEPKLDIKAQKNFINKHSVAKIKKDKNKDEEIKD